MPDTEKKRMLNIDARDVIAGVGLLLLAVGLHFVYRPLALLVPGAILCWYALSALRGHP